MKLLWREIKKHKRVLFLALFLGTVNEVFSLLDPQIFRHIVDNYASRAGELSSHDFIAGVSVLLLLSVGAAFVSRVAKAFQNYYVSVITQRTGTNLYSESVSHSFSLPYSVFEDERSGELLNKLQKARTDSQALITNMVNIIFLSAIGVIFVLIYATYVNPLIGLVYFLILPTLGTVTYLLSNKIKIAQKAIVRETASLSGSTTETLRNVELVKSLGLESQEIARLNEVNEKILRLELEKIKYVRSLDFIQGTLINALRSGILLLMLWLIFQAKISLGEFFSLMFYSFAIFEPLYMLGTVASSYQEAQASLNQLAEVLSLKPAPVPQKAKHLDEVKSIVYKDVELNYEEGSRDALQNINLNIQAGETVAFVGPSGSGKSSMIKLLSGLYPPTHGQIIFNGVDQSEVDMNDVRRRIGLVTQETQLFAGTIRENLLFVKPKATDEECLKMLQASQAQAILDKKSESGSGLNLKIGEGGVKLSGGERQRLAIARALLREPSILVFDEATSSLDSLTEKAITTTIKEIEAANPELIRVLVAHRLSTVIHADRIYVFEHGRVVESGSHEALLEKKGLYAALWREQVAAE